MFKTGSPYNKIDELCDKKMVLSFSNDVTLRQKKRSWYI